VRIFVHEKLAKGIGAQYGYHLIKKEKTEVKVLV